MALKSEQARALRRRVLGGLIRNLVLFTGAFALLCAAVEIFVVPPVANWVADSTSTWRTLNSYGQFQQIMADEGFLQNDELFDMWVIELSDAGYSTEAGTLSKVQDDVNEMQDAIAEYATMMSDPSVNGQAAADFARKEAEKFGVIDETNAAAATEGVYDAEGDIATSVQGAGEDETASGEDGGSAAQPSVPLVSYETILAAEDIVPADASAAQALAALRASASIQALRLSLALPSPLVPPETDESTAVRILVAAAVMGYSQPDLNAVLENAYRESQQQAYDAWIPLTPPEMAQAVGENDEHPVWQIEENNGVYQVRNVATYTFVKSFKLPLAAIVFVIGWFLIIFRSLDKSLRYFDDLSGAVGTLLADKSAPIELPADLSIARNELAVIRSQSLADERAAAAAEQRKNELVAYLAHDIRTPLTSVLGYLDLLRETTDLPRDTLRRYADIAYTKAERLESLINEFFEITRYNLSAIPIERETVGVRLFCQQVAEAFFPEATARNIRISIDVAGTDQFFVDPDKLARALGNVLRNAVAYADPNSTIAIAARQDARWTTITVANRGREISDAHLETIFEKFYREDGARTSRSGGAGLGLAIAKEIVVAHHGDIEAASQGGVTVFTLRIPTRGDGQAAPAQPLAPARAPRPARAAARHAEERPASRRQSPARLNPCNARPRSVPARKPVRDNTGEPRRRGPSR
ncbi:HAMP domain-containing sensor histidine kinase [Adlercreutzia sp. R25]|uniref:sensor histidine kinase n=1 Tax=Adlercreutzia shanghongiae TaxID=3111773 RepID=UPI002DBABD85|nr:HAMP domain-containing sensor histidine kinase [Adlercreutzia sp. R25]MEC4272831.1 HAMP domain-containing sensor histidine kinase [Adlercreutzia sp. R25]